MTFTRRLIGYVAAALLISFTIASAWGGQAGKGAAPSSPTPVSEPPAQETPVEPDASQLTLDIQEQGFALQLKVALGGMFYLGQKAGSAAGPELYSTVRESIAGTMRTDGKKLTAGESYLQLIAATVLKLERAQVSACRALASDTELAPVNQSVHSLAIDLCIDGGVPRPVSEEEKLEAEEAFNWFGLMLVHLVETGGSDISAIPESLQEPAISSFKRFLVALYLGGPLFLLSLLCGTVILVKFLRGKLKLRFNPSRTGSGYLLEVFALYLFAMLSIPKIIEWTIPQGSTASILSVNIIGISLCSLVAVWPLFWGVRAAELREQLGLNFGPPTRFIKDIFLGPFAYFSSLAIFFIILLLYSLVLTFLQVDPATGAHPVVPIIARSKDSQTILLIIIMATVVAPLVEELMFRGALYTWLRQFLGAGLTIVLTSVLFAALHPQGAVGVIPLTFIGMLLAFLREWRGSLTSSIVAHACVNGGTLALVLKLFG